MCGTHSSPSIVRTQRSRVLATNHPPRPQPALPLHSCNCLLPNVARGNTSRAKTEPHGYKPERLLEPCFERSLAGRGGLRKVGLTDVQETRSTWCRCSRPVLVVLSPTMSCRETNRAGYCTYRRVLWSDADSEQQSSIGACTCPSSILCGHELVESLQPVLRPHVDAQIYSHPE